MEKERRQGLHGDGKEEEGKDRWRKKEGRDDMEMGRRQRGEKERKEAGGDMVMGRRERGERESTGSYVSLVFLGRGWRGRHNPGGREHPHTQQAGRKMPSPLNASEKGESPHFQCRSADYSQPHSDSFCNFLRKLALSLASLPSSILYVVLCNVCTTHVHAIYR